MAKKGAKRYPKRCKKGIKIKKSSLKVTNKGTKNSTQRGTKNVPNRYLKTYPKRYLIVPKEVLKRTQRGTKNVPKKIPQKVPKSYPVTQKSTQIGCVLFRPDKTMGIAIQSGKTKN